MSTAVPEADLVEITESLGPLAERFSGKTILIAGGRGFLGTAIVELIDVLNGTVLDRPCRVVVIDNLISTQYRTPDANDGVTFVQHDIVEPLEWPEHVDFVIHAAGIASPYYYRKYPLETLEVATAGTKNMLLLALEHKVEGFLFFSSSEIYGDPDPRHVPIKESYRGNVSCTGPRAPYDESKRVGETLCQIFHQQHSVPATVVRPFNVYGPGMAEQDYRVLPNFASRVIAGQPLRIYGVGNQTRTFTYLTDGINGFLRALLIGTPGEAYNIGNPTPEISVVDLAKEIGAVLGRDVGFTFADYPDSYPSDEPMRRCPDITKARAQLGFEPAVDLREGLRRFLDWASKSYRHGA